MTYQPGDTFEIVYPFIRSTYVEQDADGFSEVATWRPGVRSDSFGEDVACDADGVGRMVLTVVMAVHPKPFPSRVFYTRAWIDPDGRRFGKRRLHCRSAAQFTALRRGFRVGYQMASKALT